jgi:hypothetical protein
VKHSLLAAAFTAALVAGAPPAGATLGGDVASIAVNQQRLGAARAVETTATGELHVLRQPSGMVVRQYVGNGVVYAVAWRGPHMPDLRELLGSYFAQLSSPGAHRRGGHHRMGLAAGDLVVESHGHGRSFAGRAWVTSLVPAGVDARATVGEEP